MFEFVGIETGQTLTVVNSVTHHEQGGESQVVVTYYAGQVLKLAAVYLFLLPGEFVAGCHRGLGRIGLQEFLLYLLNDCGAQIDAHGALGLGQVVQRLLLGHGRGALSAGQDYALILLGDGKL